MSQCAFEGLTTKYAAGETKSGKYKRSFNDKAVKQ